MNVSKKAERISVIIPIYNVEAYLERCLRTVCGQTYKNIEIILVDDGSTDNCLQICIEFANKDDRIKVLTQANQGVSSARNTGLENATGKFIGFVDPDDYIHPEMYERLFTLLKNNDADVSACFLRGCFDGNYEEPSRNDIEFSVYDKVGALKSVFDPKYEINGTGVVVTNKLYKKRIFNNLRFNTNLHRGEDEHIICFLMKRVEKFVITDERLYYYFHRSDSVLHRESSEVQRIGKHLELLNMYDERLSLFKEEEFNDLYNTCLINIMNLTITAFFSISNKEIKQSLINRYRNRFSEFSKRQINILSVKDKVRFFTFRIYPQLYMLILLVSMRKLTPK